MNPFNSTDLDRDFRDLPDDQKFSASFIRGFILCELVAFTIVFLIPVIVANAHEIDVFFTEVAKRLVL